MISRKPIGAGFAAALGALFAGALAAPSPADAKQYYRWITVSSQYTADTATAPVRPARYSRHGWEVRLPSGMWIPCEFNCFYTLRRNTVDFWERFQENSGN